jgi:hypothetical protein
MALAQNSVQSALVTAALAFKPFQHVGIYPHGQLLFDGPVKLAALCTLPVCALRGGQVRKVNFAFRLGGQCGEFFTNQIRYFVHTLSFQSSLRAGLKQCEYARCHRPHQPMCGLPVAAHSRPLSLLFATVARRFQYRLVGLYNGSSNTSFTASKLTPYRAELLAFCSRPRKTPVTSYL